MESYAIYSHKADLNLILELIKNEFPKASFEQHEEKGILVSKFELKGGLFSSNKSLQINHRQRINLSYKLDEIECPLTQQLTGMRNFIGQLPAQDEKVQDLLQRKIETINAETIFVVEPKMTDDFLKILKNLAQILEAVLFVRPQQSQSKSDVQHFLDSNLDLILDVNGRTGTANISVNIESKYFDTPKAPTLDQVERKAKSEQYLAQHEVDVNKNMPHTVSEADVQLRTKAEIIERTYALALIAVKGEGAPQSDLDRIKNQLIINGLSPQEQYVYNNSNLTEQESAYATWRYESLTVLLWSLGFLGDVSYPSEICDVPKVASLVFQKSRSDFEQQAKLRPAYKILDVLDKTYRMNWACVNARIKGQSPSGALNGSILYERHYALNWLTNYMNQDWDQVRTDT